MCMSSDASAIPSGPAGRLVRHYKMERIPDEGAWFALRWVSEARVPASVSPTSRGGMARPAGSAIVALVTRRDFSAMHRLRTDETWHFYGGDAAELLLLHPDGRVERVRLGADVFAGEQPQVTVRAGTWMGARPAKEGDEVYSFFGCTLAPGFDPDDYEPGYRDELQAGWPEAAEAIAALTREDSRTRPTAPGTDDGREAEGVPASRVFGPEAAAEIALGPGVTLRELVGRVGVERTEAVSLAKFRLEAGASTGSSRYFGCDEFFVVLSGTGVARLNGMETSVRAGSVVAIARGDPHALRADGEGPLEFIAVLAPAFQPECYEPER